MMSGLKRLADVSCPTPGGAFYAFASVAGLLGRRLGGAVVDPTGTLCTRLLKEADLSLVPGKPFGAPDHIRLSFATGLSDIRRGLERLAGVIAAFD
jgi:aspartate aminotransferase